MSSEQQRVKLEILNDPASLGYSSMTDAEVLAAMKLQNISKNKKSVTGDEVWNALVEAEYDLLTEPEKLQIREIVYSGVVDPFGLAAKVIKDVLSGSQSLANLASIRVYLVSRAQEIGVPDIVLPMIEGARS